MQLLTVVDRISKIFNKLLQNSCNHTSNHSSPSPQFPSIPSPFSFIPPRTFTSYNKCNVNSPSIFTIHTAPSPPRLLNSVHLSIYTSSPSAPLALHTSFHSLPPPSLPMLHTLFIPTPIPAIGLYTSTIHISSPPQLSFENTPPCHSPSIIQIPQPSSSSSFHRSTMVLHGPP